MKLHKSHLSTGLLLALFATFVVGAPASEAATRSVITEQAIQACVLEIGKRADYNNAARATHLIARLKQKNLAELSIEIETAVHVDADEAPVRTYKTSCITDPSHKIVKFKMTAIDRIAS